VDTVVAAGATVLRTHAVEAQVGPGASVGPFAYLRPGTRLAAGSKVGTFVETKNAELGEKAKVPHLTYVGDATIGPRANVGAGTIFANYDGVGKYHTTVGEAAFVGSDSVLLAPVEIGPGAYVAAGSAVHQDVPPGALGVARGQQRNIEGWVAKRRAGTVSADAAQRAQADVAGASGPGVVPGGAGEGEASHDGPPVGGARPAPGDTARD
jgi:bifunctional UDP-N-acetylglucosamine pyrophosphorylase/glucosamine-1-phosphate N-acetyltransferase